MGDCDDAVHRLYDFLDGELDDDRRAHIKQHLDECLPCLEAFDFEAELRMVIAQKCREQVPDHLRQRIFQALQQEGGGLTL
jgi:mycothiol system anti-sigma-R factor